MDKQVIEQKLESLLRCVQRVREKCPASADMLAKKPDLQDILSLNLSRAVQLCVDIGAHLVAGMDVPPPATMGGTFDVLAEQEIIPLRLAERLKSAVGFRNIDVHNYEAINWTVVHSIATRHLDDFSDFASAALPEDGR